MMPRHFLQLAGADTLQTTSFALTAEAVRKAGRSQAMAVIHGPAGAGKSFAVEHAASELEDVETAWTVFPSQASQKRVVKQLLQALTGVNHSGDCYDLIDTALTVLGETRRLIVIDEAQELSWRGLELLRHLWDYPETSFGLALVGADGCWELISKYPPLESRVLRRVAFNPLARSEVLDLMPRFHPLYRQTPPAVIGFIDENFGHGNLRNWARFTQDAAEFCAQRDLGAVTQELAAAVFLLQRGTKSASPRASRTRSRTPRRQRV